MSIGAVATGIGAGLGGLFGGGGKTQAAVPADLRGPRADQIALLNYLLGFGGGGSTGQPIDDFLHGFMPSGRGRLPQFGDPTARLESYFGSLGVPQSDLQRQALGGISQFLNQPAPEQRALDISLPALQGILGGKPGAGIIDALQPQFQRNLASANQQGARFGSANAILRSRALEDFNLLGAQAAQQGIQQQIQAAEALRLLGESAGQNPFARLQAGYGVGQQAAGQADIERQRRLQILLQLLGTAQSATLGLPVTQQPGFFQNALGGGLGVATILQALGGGSRGERIPNAPPTPVPTTPIPSWPF